jgi:putative ABC transport system permease protein
MTSASIAFRNVRKSLRDYTIYFLTLTFGVCIFYVFNALETQQAMMEVTNNQARLFQELKMMMGTISLFISFILGFLIIYANRFLIKRRKKEFGVYMVLGMKKGEISRILIMETAFVGVFSLVVGIALGVAASEGMALVTANLLQAKITKFVFAFSMDAAIKTVIYFGVIFLLVLLFNTAMIGRQKLINLLYASRKNEWFKTPRLSLSVLLFLVSAGCIGFAYVSLLSGGVGALTSGNVLPLALVAGVAGTFLFFFSLAGFFLKVVQQSKKLYLKDLNMFVLRQLNSKINTTYISMSMMCIMLFISVMTLSSGIGLSANLAKELRQNSPYDATFSVSAKAAKKDKPAPEYQGMDLVAAIAENGVGLDTFAKDYLAVRYHTADLQIPLEVTENNITNAVNANTYFLGLSDYNAALKMRGAQPISLDGDSYAVNFPVTNAAYRAAVANYADKGSPIELHGVELRTSAKNLYSNVMENSQHEDYNLTIVVPDNLVNSLPVLRDVLHINYLQQTDMYDSLCQKGLAKLSLGKKVSTKLMTRVEISHYNNSITTVLAYLAIYLGVVFLITAAAVLAIGQLSETSDNIGRYGLLRKLGTDDKMIDKALFTQILIYFGAPMLLAIVHAAVGISFIGNVVSVFDKGDIAGSALVTAAMILVVYGGYFLATYFGSKGILRRDYRAS